MSGYQLPKAYVYKFVYLNPYPELSFSKFFAISFIFESYVLSNSHRLSDVIKI